MKIIIIGGGPSGLSLYLFLSKYLPPPTHSPDDPESPTHSITIYESHATTTSSSSTIGGALGIAPNGMKALASLDPELHDAILKRGYPVDRFQFKSARNWVLGSMGCSGKREKMVMIKRQDVWDELRRRVQQGVVREGRRVVEVYGWTGDEEGGKKCIVRFEDGEVEEADTVIGADGVGSVVRNAVVEGVKQKYEGLLGVGGICSSSLFPSPPNDPDKHSSSTVMTFGPNGFFGYGISSSAPDTDVHSSKPPTYGLGGMWWSTCECADVPEKKDFDHHEIKKKLLERHAGWKEPTIQRIIKEATVELATQSWTVPELPRWYKDGLVLVGDAAHGLPSTSGQGISQALEDGHAFSLLLRHYLLQPPKTSSLNISITAASETYTHLRKPRTNHIYRYSSRMAGHKKNQGFCMEMLTYFFMWLFGKLMKFQKWGLLFDYDVEEEVEKILEIGGEAYEKDYERKVKKSWL